MMQGAKAVSSPWTASTRARPFSAGVVALLLAGCGASSSSCPEASAIEAALPEGRTQLTAHADEIAWMSCPPTLPAGCEMAVLEGDPKREALFTVRFRIKAELEMKPHWHPRNERVTILEGRVGVGFGDVIDRQRVIWFGPGDYYVNAEEAHHFVLTDGPAELQITGIGPWEVRYLEDELQ
jgi:hypothetical protein